VALISDPLNKIPQLLRSSAVRQDSLAISRTRSPPTKAPKQPEPTASHKQDSGIDSIDERPHPASTRAGRTPSLNFFLSTIPARVRGLGLPAVKMHRGVFWTGYRTGMCWRRGAPIRSYPP
jgi:hypothetical protein